jgi:hypothetical protein
LAEIGGNAEIDYRPFKAKTRVRIPLGTIQKSTLDATETSLDQWTDKPLRGV